MDLTDKPKITGPDSPDKLALERRLRKAEEAQPSTLRCYNMELGGEVRTSVTREDGLYSIAESEVPRPNGTSEVVGKAQYTLASGEATLDNTQFTARNYWVESALLRKVSEQASLQGANRLRVWIPDDDQGARTRWLRHGFQPTERDPGARGVYWERPLS
jgi:hypothetical protein